MRFYRRWVTDLESYEKRKSIKCFVSMRTDMKNVKIVDNSLYIPVYCGAELGAEKNTKIIGDNTGDNISKQKDFLSEFTVQYWAWKNVKADYYGLCHYRRYLAFRMPHGVLKESEIHYRIPYLNDFFLNRLGLLNEEIQRSEIEKYDVLVNESADVRCIINRYGKQKTVYSHWKIVANNMLDTNYIDYMMKVIEQKRSDIYISACHYMYGVQHRGFNCYWMKAEIFYAMNEFQFEILEGVAEYAQKNQVPLYIKRTYGYLGEILYGIYVFFLIEQGKYKIKELPLVFAMNTDIGNESIIKSVMGILKLWTIQRLWQMCNIILPYGTRGRIYVTKLWRMFRFKL